MKSRLKRIVFASVAAAIAVAAPARAGQQPALQCKPVVGSFETTSPTAICASPLDPFKTCFTGRLWGGLNGTFEAVQMDIGGLNVLDEFRDVGFFGGRITMTLKSGLVLFGTESGTRPVSSKASTSVITFSNPQGSGVIRLRGEYNSDGPPWLSGDYLGTICVP